MTTVLKLGGELLEDAGTLGRLAAEIAGLAEHGPLVVVHGGGRAIDAELAARGLATRAVDGLRITDGPTLDVVVGVLAGQMNTRLVAAIVAAGGRAVGLTGADDGIGLSAVAAPHEAADGSTVNLGLVGRPTAARAPRLLGDLCRGGYVPVVASLGTTADGRLLNINADTFAAHLAVGLRAARLLVAGGTPGVLDADGRTIPCLDIDAIDGLVGAGQAHSGMVAKLAACRDAWLGGVRDIRVVDGRESLAFDGPSATILMGPAVQRT
jgi:acetylglutamate kinase